jgi:uncharacterized protein (TIGR02145 family)
MRNADGSVMASSAVDLTFMIHDGSDAGTMIYQESHALMSNAQGLVSCVVGNGVVSQGNFANINWGSGAKFLHVLMGATDLGTQQMLSVPYALYSSRVNVSVSQTGDTLTIGGNSVIVPGISALNPVSMSNYGSVLLSGNTTCQSEYISVTGCGGQDSLLYQDLYYSLTEIGGQCWFAENLATDKYNNGVAIENITSNSSWAQTVSPAYCWYNNNIGLKDIYGALYNWYAISNGNLCPTGWHVPSDCEWMYLENYIGMSVANQQIQGDRGAPLGGKLKSTESYWLSPNSTATNELTFFARPGGYRACSTGAFMDINFYGGWSTSTNLDANNHWYRGLFSNSGIIRRNISGCANPGASLRCIKD